MGTKYTTVGNTGYNASPPADDGSAVPTNEIKWSTIKEKLPDVLKTQIEAVESTIVTALDESVVDKAIAYTTTAANHKQTINITASATISLGDASTMGTGYVVTIKNSHTAANTVDLVTGADTLDGTAAGSIILGAKSSATFIVNSNADGYLKLGDLKEPSKGADIASATVLPFQSAAYADVTGTTTITSIETSGIIGTVIKRQFDGILTLTHHATDLILPGATDITTAAGDEAEFVEYASGDWRCTNYQVASVVPANIKIIDIGDWNMDSTAQVSVPHGLTMADIRSISAVVRADDGLRHDMLPSASTSGTQTMWADATNVTLNRLGSGSFDSTAYDSTSYNRGWITIIYV